MWRKFIQELPHNGNRALFSCRNLDYSEPLSNKEFDFDVPRIQVKDLSDKQMRQFLRQYLPESAENVWQELVDTRLLQTFGRPYFLKLLCKYVDANGALPQGRASLFTDIVRKTLKREMEGGNAIFQNGYLLTSRDRRQISQGQCQRPEPDQYT